MSVPGFERINISPDLIGEDPDKRRHALSELNNQLDEIWNYLKLVAETTGAGSSGLAGTDENYVVHGDTLPTTLPNAELHRDMAGDDLHVPKIHASSRHDKNQADPLNTSAPSDIAASNAEGSANDYVRSDHAHRGVRSLSKSGASDLFGDVTLTGSAGITLNQVGQNIDITGGGVGTGSFIDNEALTRITATQYTLANTPISQDSLIVVVIYPGGSAGVVCTNGNGFTFSAATTIDFTDSITAGSAVLGFYRI